MEDRAGFSKDPGNRPAGREREKGAGFLSPHDHACLIYERLEDELPLLMDYVLEGFSRKERVLCILDEPRRSLFEKTLADAGTDLETRTRDQSFSLIGPKQAYLAGDCFDPEAMTKILGAETDEALRSGFSGLRVLGEAAWSTQGFPGAERLMEYESQLALFFPVRPCTALCLYDKTKLPAKVLRDAILTHPLILYKGEVCTNSFYIAPEEYQTPVRDAMVVDSLLAGLAHQAAWMKEADREISWLDASRRSFLDNFNGIAFQAPVGAFSPLFLEGDVTGLSGYEPDDFKSGAVTWEQVIHSEDVALAKAEITRLWNEPDYVADFQYRIVAKGGERKWVRECTRSIMGPDGRRMVQGVIQDVTPIRQVVDLVKASEARLSCLLEIARHRAESEQELLDFALGKALLLTRSKIGYIYHYDEETAVFTLNSWSRGVMAECSVMEKQTVYELAKTGLWGEAVRQRKPLVVADYQEENPQKKGCPPGHVPLSTFLSVPVFSGDKIVAVLGLANKRKPYDEIDVLQATLLMDSVWKMVEKGRAEEAARREKERAARYLEIAPAIILVLDRNGDITLINEKGCEILECAREDAVGANWFESFLPVEVLESVRAIWDGLMKGDQEVFEFAENLVVTKKGRRRIIRWHNRLLRENGRISGILSSGEDVTAQRQAEEDLRLSEERYRTTLYSIGDGVITTDLNGRVMKMNKVAENLTGWNEREAASRPIEEVFVIANEFTREPVESPVPRVLREGLVVGLANHTVLISKGGAVRPIADSGAPIRNSGGEVSGVVLVFADQSDRRQMEEELRQSQKMEAIGRLAGGIAHDFNNMLGVIIGNADLALLGLTPSDPLYHDLKEIDRAARRSADLTRQLLAFARKQPVSPKVLNLGEAVEEAKKMLSRLIGEGIGFRLKLQKGLWPVLLDPAQLDQILANLTVNARDAINGTGTIRVGLENQVVDGGAHIRSETVRPGEYVVLSVADDGCGMDDHVREHLFEPFFTTKEQGKGTGLGLCTVHGIVSQNQGFVDYETKPGNGTTFRIFLPRHEGKIAPERPSDQMLKLSGTETVLVVEDEEQVLNLVTAMLKRFGYQILSARNPGDALLLCERHSGPIELLLTDVVMPLMNGRDLRDRLVELRPELKSLFMSGYTEEIVASRNSADPSVHFLQKPFTAMDLARKVREVLDAG
ncbi:MAG: PAS domain S-box protein [Thermodesulfobacteriota bacterium]